MNYKRKKYKKKVAGVVHSTWGRMIHKWYVRYLSDVGRRLREN